MSKWLLTSALLCFVLWTQTVLALEVGERSPVGEDVDVNDDETSETFDNDDLSITEGDALPNVTSKLRCQDRGCAAEGGKCGSYWFAACKYKTTNLCKGFCTCCVPCGGTCGSGGTCRASRCGTGEIEIGGGCGSSRCKCCGGIPQCSGKCGAGNEGTCKESCNSVIEDEVSGQCNLAGCKCCKPKPSCTGRCGRKNKFFCRRKETCNFFNWRPGKCASGDCRCCKK